LGVFEKEIKERVRSPQNKLKNLQEKELPRENPVDSYFYLIETY